MWKKILGWGLVAIWLVIIFCFSSQNAKESANESRTFLNNMVEFGSNIANKLGIIKEKLTENDVKMIVKKLHRPVRKLAHVMIYFVLAILLLFALNTKQETMIKKCLIVLLLCFAYSITDEIHQTLIDGRSGEFLDCLIDTMGASVACLIYMLVLKIKNIYKST